MISGLFARICGPGATLLLLAALAVWPSEYTAAYAVLASYLQLATAPLNPYTEHYQLRQILKGHVNYFGSGLVALGVMWLTSLSLVIALGHSLLILVIFPILGLGHLLLKIRAAHLRANQQNTLAIALEFSFRPIVLLIGILGMFLAFGASNWVLEVAFGLSGIATILIAVLLAYIPSLQKLSALASSPTSKTLLSGSNKQGGNFLFLGALMVLGTQFEVFALDMFGSVEDLSAYKVAMQLASVCGVTTNFVLMNKLRELYANDIQSDNYRTIFRGIQMQTFVISASFMTVFFTVGLGWAPLWSKSTWLLAGVASAVLSVSAAFGPLANWFFASGRVSIVIFSILLMVSIKVLLFYFLNLEDIVSALTLIIVTGAGLIGQNTFLLTMKRRLSK